MTEEWKGIKGYEGLYSASSYGRVRSYVIYRKNGKVLKAQVGSNGYLSVSLYKDGCKRPKYIHRLVAEAFIPNPLGKSQVNHKDCNKVNNHVNNLEWVTPTEDRHHAVKMGRFIPASRVSKIITRLSEQDVLEIRESYLAGATPQELAEGYYISPGYVRKILSRKRRTHI